YVDRVNPLHFLLEIKAAEDIRERIAERKTASSHLKHSIRERTPRTFLAPQMRNFGVGNAEFTSLRLFSSPLNNASCGAAIALAGHGFLVVFIRWRRHDKAKRGIAPNCRTA